MHNQQKQLLLIKIIHTAIWIFFNIVTFYLLYAVLVNKIDKWFWIGWASFGIETIVLLSFKMVCPLTILAKKYTTSRKENFDIFLPSWLAKHNKLIYGLILAGVLVIYLYRVFVK